MKDGAFLQKITITRQATTWDETTKRPKTGTSSTISTGVKALLSHQSAGESDALMGVLPTNRTLLLRGADCRLAQERCGEGRVER